MRKFRIFVILAAVLGISLAATACGAAGSSAGGSGGTGNGGGTSGSGTSSGGSTVTKSKPTSVPTITLAFCQKILTVSEANQIMHPTTAATTIRIDSNANGGSCNYEYAPYRSVLTIAFFPYAGQDPAQALSAAANQLANVQGATVTTTNISGVGDAALFVTSAISVQGLNRKADGVDVIYGAVLFSCGNFNVGSSPDSTQLSALKQVAQLVISRM